MAPECFVVTEATKCQRQKVQDVGAAFGFAFVFCKTQIQAGIFHVTGPFPDQFTLALAPALCSPCKTIQSQRTG